MRLLIDPYTNLPISKNNQTGSFIRWKSKELKISSYDLRLKIYQKTWPEIDTKEKFEHYYITLEYSLPIFVKEFEVPYHITQFFIKYYNSPKRNIKLAAKIGAKRSKKTNLKRYGVDQTFKVKEFDDKRKSTYLKTLGVDNPFKLKNFARIYADSYLEKYGMTNSQLKSKRGIEHWESLSQEDRQDWLIDTILSPEAKKCFGRISRLEKRISSILSHNAIIFEPQKRIGDFWFDFYIPEYNLLVEVNGTIWHMDPRIYEANDVNPITKESAKCKWEKDRVKLDSVKGTYKLVTIWEYDMASMTDNNILQIIKESIL